MRVLQISLFYHPDRTGIAVTSTEFAEWFAAHGMDMTVITALPFYPEWRIKNENRSQCRETEEINKVKVKRCNIYVPLKINTVTRMLHEMSFIWNVFWKVIQEHKYDVVILVSPPLTLGLIGIFLKKLWKTKIIFNVKDLVPDAAIELHMLHNRIFINIMYFIEKTIYHKSDAIASLGHGILKRIENKGISREKLFYLPDGADPYLLNSYQKTMTQNQFLLKNNIKKDFLVLHSGNMGVKQGIDVVIKAAKILNNYPIQFCIVGDGVMKNNLMNLAKQYKLNNILFLPLQPRDILADMYHAADICLLTQKKEVVDIVVPSKLISMMAAGSCILASVNPQSEAAKIVENANCGSVVDAEDADLLAEEVVYYFNNRKTIDKLRTHSKKFITKYHNRDSAMLNYLSLLKYLTTDL